jgi:hypothetical protein
MAGTQPPQIEGLRGILVYSGLGTPLARAFVAGTVVGLGVYAAKLPVASFDEKGEIRPFKPFSKAPNATNAHFLAVPIGAAALAFLFT